MNTTKPRKIDRDVFLLPGEFAIGHDGQSIRTLLGSCVSITLWHPHEKIGAMSHYLLSARQKPRSGPLSGRYGEEALELMIAGLVAQGIAPDECQAKVFGGADMFPRRERPDTQRIGMKNGRTAEQMLQARGIEIASTSLYGEGHRKIIFDVGSGDVWVRQVSPGEIVLPAPAEKEAL